MNIGLCRQRLAGAGATLRDRRGFGGRPLTLLPRLLRCRDRELLVAVIRAEHVGDVSDGFRASFCLWPFIVASDAVQPSSPDHQLPPPCSARRTLASA